MSVPALLGFLRTEFYFPLKEGTTLHFSSTWTPGVSEFPESGIRRIVGDRREKTKEKENKKVKNGEKQLYPYHEWTVARTFVLQKNVSLKHEHGLSRQWCSAGEFCLLLFTTDFLRFSLSLSVFFSLSLFWSGVRPQEVNQIEAPRKNSPQKEKLLRFSRDLRGCIGERRTWVSLQSCSESLCETLACLIVKEGGGRVKSFMCVRRLDAQFGTVLIPQSSGGCLIS